MGTFKDQLLADLAIFYDVEDGFAEEVVYVSKNTQENYAVPALIDRTGYQSSQAGAGSYAQVRVRKSDIALAGPGDTIVFDGKTWTVAKVESESPREWSLVAHSGESCAFDISQRL